MSNTNDMIIEYAHKLQDEDKYEALMAGRPVVLEHLAVYMERAKAHLISENNEAMFGTVCIDCGRGFGDEEPTVADQDGNLLHVGCGDPDALADEEGS